MEQTKKKKPDVGSGENLVHRMKDPYLYPDGTQVETLCGLVVTHKTISTAEWRSMPRCVVCQDLYGKF